MGPARRPRLIPRSSRRRSSQAPADARLSPQGHGRIGLLTAGIPAHPRSGRKRHDRPVTPELAVRVLSFPLQDSPANAGVSRRRARSARPRDRAPGWGQPCPAKRKTAALRRFHGASRTRTGDLLGAISALSWPEFGLTSGFSSLRDSSPNTFPNILQPVLQRIGRPGGRPIAMRGGLVTGAQPPEP